MKKSSTASTGHFNQKVAKTRGESWQKKLALGKLEHLSAPSELRRRRVAQGFSQKRISEALSLKTASYGEIERGKRAVKKERAMAIAKLLKAPLKAIFKPHERLTHKLLAIRSVV